MTASPLAVMSFSLSEPNITTLIYVLIGVVVFIGFLIASRLVARFVADQLRARQIHAEMVVLVRRVVTIVVLAVGVFAAIGFALRDGNVTLLGILLATVVAALGVQDLLKDYVSGYYVLVERHIRVGDRISMEGVGSGTVTDVKLRVTLLKTDSGDLVVVPNSELFNKSVTVHVRAVERAAEAKSEPPA